MFSRIEFFFMETFTSLRRHPAMAFAATVCIAASLFVIGIVVLAILNLNYAMQITMNRMRFNVYFHDEVSRQEAWVSYKRLLALPGVVEAETKFIPREKATAWLEWKAKHPDAEELLERNPLPDSVTVKVTDLQEIGNLKNTLLKWDTVDSIGDKKDLADKLTTIALMIQKSGMVVGIILLILSLVIIHHTIELTLYARRREMFIMSLVGATPGTVAVPFLLEGIVYGLSGGMIALGVLFGLYRLAIDQVLANFNVQMMTVDQLLGTGILAVLAAGATLGLCGSLISVLKYLRSPRSRLTNA